MELGHSHQGERSGCNMGPENQAFGLGTVCSDLSRRDVLLKGLLKRCL